MSKYFYKPIGLISLTLLITFSCTGQSSEKQMPLKDLLVLSDGDSITIEALMKKRGLVGLSMVVFEDYKIKEKQSWGEKEVDTQMMIDNETVFSTASISKAITATLIAKLAHEGRINLDIPINTYLKRWKLAENDFTRDNPVTMRHLLLHTAGTTQGGFEDYYEGDEVPSVIQSLNGEIALYNEPVKIVFDPGSRLQYSGGGYTIAMVALEDHLGRSLQSLAKEHFFDPIGMQHSTFIQPGEPGFFTNAAKAHNEQGIPYGLPICPQLSASGLWSNPTDMSLFLIEIQKGLEGKSKVFAESMTKEMLVPAAYAMGFADRSLGWEVHGYGNFDWFAHGGANTGTGGHIYASHQGGRGLAIFGNGPNGIRLPILEEVRKAVIEAYGWKRSIKEKYALSGGYVLDESFRGRYMAAPGGISLVQRGHKVILSPGENGPVVFELFHIGEDRFAVDEASFQFELFKDSETNESYMGVSGNGRKSPTMDFRRISANPQSPVEYFEANGFQKSLKYFKKLSDDKTTVSEVQEGNLNALGYDYLGRKDMQKAIDLFRIIVALYPESANAYDSLGEAYLANDDKENARKNYQKSLDLNPGNETAKRVLSTLK